ncbi:MAG: hemerythrin family protein [Rhodoferax sp.]|uniref:bacteriohemerythrin n=1 Tax=Rhodoferax sp. TaxID=50421 RepID=UPI002632ADA1|nr:hemerythrin family protein [Rhodoferax sp.]MDD2881751.1 hemerythrin family protein [Rhodoferax sp.]
MGVEWFDSYKTGDEAIDATQKKLFELTNAFLASDDLTVLRPVIVALCKQAKAHFELEEALMQRIGFPDMDAHKAQHQRLLDRLISRSMDVGKGHMNKPAIAALMQDWALHHVPEEDAHLTQYLVASKAA